MATERQVTELEVRADQAISAVRNFAKELEHAATAADDLAKAQAAEAAASGKAAQSIDLSAREVRKAQRDYDQLLQKLDPVARAQAVATKEMERYAAAMRTAGVPISDQTRLLQALAQHHERHIAGINNAGQASSRFGGIMQQVGFQVGDVATQVSMGTNAFQAMGVQAGQLLGVFGPVGAVLGAVAVAGGALAGKFLDLGEATLSAADAQKLFNDALREGKNLTENSEVAGKRQAEEARERALATLTEAYAQERLNLAKAKGWLENNAAFGSGEQVNASVTERANAAIRAAELRLAEIEGQVAGLLNPAPDSKLYGDLNNAEIERATDLLGQLKDRSEEAGKAAKKHTDEQAKAAADLLRDIEKESEARAKARDAVDRQAAGYEQESYALSLSERSAEVYRAGLKAEAELLKANIDLNDEHARAQVEAAKTAAGNLFDAKQVKADAKKAEDARLDAIKDAEKERLRISERVTDSAASYFADAMMDKNKDIGARLRDTLIRSIYEASAQAVLRVPVQMATGAVMSGVSALGLSGVMGFKSGGAAGGGVGGAAGAGGIDPLGAGSLGYQIGSMGGGGFGGGITSSVNNWGALNLGTASGAAPSAVTLGGDVVSIAGTMRGADGALYAVTTSGEVVEVAGTMAGSGAGYTFTDWLGIGGAALTNVLALTSGTPAQKVLTPAATGIGWAIGGPVGAGIGAAAGNLIGGLFGRKKSVNVPIGPIGYQTSVEQTIGAGNRIVTPMDVLGQTVMGDQRWGRGDGMQYGWAWANSNIYPGTSGPVVGNQAKLLEMTSNLGFRYGADLAGQNVGTVARDGKMYLFTRRADNKADQFSTSGALAGPAAAQFELDSTKQESINDAIARLSVVMLARAGTIANDNLAKAIKKIDTSLDAKSINDLLAFAENFSDALQTMSGGVTDITQAVGVQTRTEVMKTIAAITDFREKTEKLGLDTNAAAGATKKAVEVMLGLRDAAEPLSEVEKSLQALEAKFANIGPLLEMVGITTDPATLKAQALTNIRSGFEQSLADTITQITDPASLVRQAEQKRYEQQIEDAQKLGADLAKVHELHRLNLLGIEKQYNSAESQAREQASAGVLATVTDLGQLVRQWQYGDQSALSPEAQLGLAERTYNAVSGAARAGDFRSYQQFGATADQYLTEARTIYGSGAGYADAFARVMQDAMQLMQRDPQDLVARAVEDSARAQIDTLRTGFSELKATMQAVLTELRQGNSAPARAA